jgi:hypothetical protein
MLNKFTNYRLDLLISVERHHPRILVNIYTLTMTVQSVTRRVKITRSKQTDIWSIGQKQKLSDRVTTFISLALSVSAVGVVVVGRL